MSRVLVVGDVMTDIIVEPEGAIVPGSDRRATITSRPGGSGANQAVWLAASGVEVAFVARVGAGDLGSLTRHFESVGVAPILRPDRERGSGVLISLIGPDGERSFLTDRGANLALSGEDLPPELLAGSGLLLLSGYSFFAKGPRAAVMGLAEQARRRGIPVAVDPASVGFLEEVGAARFLAWTGGAALILANGAEAACLTGLTDLEEQMRALTARYPRVVIKLGPGGAALGEAGSPVLHLPAPPVPVRDTTGAGDAFAAAFIAADLRGASGAAALAAGIAAGALAVGQLGGQPPRPGERR